MILPLEILLPAIGFIVLGALGLGWKIVFRGARESAADALNGPLRKDISNLGDLVVDGFGELRSDVRLVREENIATRNELQELRLDIRELGRTNVTNMKDISDLQVRAKEMHERLLSYKLSAHEWAMLQEEIQNAVMLAMKAQAQEI